ncbi:hypothetical protein GCM10009555_063460 [Acrocarpospora macrocephala]|uniref:Uncharacterized protein n=1 Tax=Acrocarpospora macrocephala TaxID=150177 RepID=A0A5M3WHM2_9ACTN|nr:hypothetical protein Amac_013140 [Acrocarpospora macrocephala]
MRTYADELGGYLARIGAIALLTAEQVTVTGSQTRVRREASSNSQVARAAFRPYSASRHSATSSAVTMTG